VKRSHYSEHLARLGRVAVAARDPQAVLDQACVVAAEALHLEVTRIFLRDSGCSALRVVSGVGLVVGQEVGAEVLYEPGTCWERLLAGKEALTVPKAYLEAGLISALWVALSGQGRALGLFCVCSRNITSFGTNEVKFLECLAQWVVMSLQRAQLEEALGQAQRFKSVGELTGGIAHDFNNLLAVIQGNLQALAGLPALAQHLDGQQMVAAAAQATRRGAGLTHKLLAFPMRSAMNPVTVDVAALLQSLAHMLCRTLGAHIGVEVMVTPKCPPVQADLAQLEAALLNLALNARDAMPDGGTLRFQSAECQMPPTASLDIDQSAQGFVAIAISDTGIGMSAQVKARVLEPFFTTKAAGRGAGLGLSTVCDFVKQSRGAMSIESAPGAGTTITLYLPQAQFTGAE
jgi:signal transduction histidine kinase